MNMCRVIGTVLYGYHPAAIWAAILDFSGFQDTESLANGLTAFLDPKNLRLDIKIIILG